MISFTFHPSLEEQASMKIFYINNVGSGFAEQIEIDSGTTLGALFAKKDARIQSPRLPHPGKPPARRRGRGPDGGMPGQHHTHQDRRGQSRLRVSSIRLFLVSPLGIPAGSFLSRLEVIHNEEKRSASMFCGSHFSIFRAAELPLQPAI
jgi:hypothetical protein